MARAKDNWRQNMREIAPLLSFGTQIALTMGFFVGAGYMLDRRLGTEPWILLVLAMLGIASVFVRLYRMVSDLNSASSRKRPS